MILYGFLEKLEVTTIALDRLGTDLRPSPGLQRFLTNDFGQ